MKGMSVINVRAAKACAGMVSEFAAGAGMSVINVRAVKACGLRVNSCTR